MTKTNNRTPAIPKITLEDYQKFLDNPCFKEGMKNDHLNQIIQMSGFFKLHRRPKTVLLEALSKIDVIKPQRSTLHETISPYAFSLTVDQVNEDLDALEWQECPVQLLETLTDHHHHHTVINGGKEDFKITVTKPRSKRGRKRKAKYQNVVYVDEVVNGGCGDVAAVDEVVNGGRGDVAAVDDVDHVFADLLPLWYPS